MAIDNGNYIAGMNINIPANTDPRYEGAEQIRAVKRMVQESFPNIDGVVTSDVATLNSMTDGTQGRFIGETTMFQGLVEDIPEGWVLSDGSIQNGYQTADLRNKFIMGYNDVQSSSQPIRDTGGNTNPVLTDFLVSEPHTLVEAQIPEHKHAGWGENYFEDGIGFGVATEYGTSNPGSGDSDNNNSLYYTEPVGGGQAHSHDLTDDGTFDNRPDYVVLAFIVYVGKTA